MTALLGAMPAGGGLRDDDWAHRHRLLTRLLGGAVAALTVFGAFQQDLGQAWLITVLLVLTCVVAAVRQ